jgi:hypothetical protein
MIVLGSRMFLGMVYTKKNMVTGVKELIDMVSQG